VNAADVVSTAGGHRSVGGITEDNGIDLVGIVIVFLVGSRGAPECGACRALTAAAAGTEMCSAAVTQGVEDRGQCTGGDNDCKQDGCGAERLAARDIEAGCTEYGEIGLSRRRPGWRRSGEVAHTDSVDALPMGGV
jgi:hypothetical protein